MLIITFSKIFKKSFKKKDNFVQKKALERIQLFRENSNNILLNNHKLHGEYFGFRSINITGNYRAIFKYSDKNNIVFTDIGTHTELYG